MLSYLQKKIFRKISFIFIIGTVLLVWATYSVVSSDVFEKDNILDAHDAYYHFKLVESWNNDTTLVRRELENLKIQAKVYLVDSDTVCENDVSYWENSAASFSLCDYISYQDSDYLMKEHKIVFPERVSFGDLYFNNALYPATLVHSGGLKYLLLVDYVYPLAFLSFLPVVLLFVLFMLVLYLVIRSFLLPINIMQKRIVALEGGDLSSKIDVSGKDELALLGHNFNELVAQIKKLLKQKERLLSDVSHELRTPLSKMRLLLAMVPQNEKIKTVERQINYLDSIINNILISDKLSAPYSLLDIKEISIKNLINQGLDLSKHSFVKMNIKNDFLVFCDPIKISVVIKNLLDNAEKYAPSKRGVLILAQINNNIVTIQVQDFGPGIEDSVLKNITKPYVRGENLKKSGFGLGLSICKKIMSSHIGTFSAENNVKEGACFSISWNNKDIVTKYAKK